MDFLNDFNLIEPAGIAAAAAIIFELVKMLGLKKLKGTTPNYPIIALGIILGISLGLSFLTLAILPEPPTITKIIVNAIGGALLASGKYEWFSKIYRKLVGSDKKRFEDNVGGVKFLIPIAFIFALSCSPATNTQPTTDQTMKISSGTVIAGINLIAQSLLKPEICKLAKSNSEAWTIVKKSLDEMVLPTLNASDPKIKAIDEWIDLLLDDPKVNTSIVMLIQNTLNIAFEFIPTEDLNKVMEENQNIKYVIDIIKGSLAIFSDIIGECLKE